MAIALGPFVLYLDLFDEKYNQNTIKIQSKTILNQLKERRYFCNGQVPHQFYRPRGVDTITAEMEDTTIAGSNIPGEASNKAPGAMVQDSTKSSSGTGDRRSKGGRYKDLEHAILDLHLRVALLTV